MKKTMIASLAAAGMLFAVAGQAHAGATLDAVKKKGFVQCGISDGLPGFSYADANGKFSGIDVDVCRGVAAALFGDDTKVKYTPLTAKERFTALQSGEVDVLSRNTTWTSSRDAGMGMTFTGVTYYDGIGFLTHNKARPEECERTRRRDCLYSGRYGYRAERRGLFQSEQDEIHPRDVRSL